MSYASATLFYGFTGMLEINAHRDAPSAVLRSQAPQSTLQELREMRFSYQDVAGSYQGIALALAMP